MQIDLNISRTRLVTYLQHNSVVIHTRNSLFSIKSAANYKDKVSPDGECLHSDHCITCITIKLKNMININCDLVFHDECPG